MAGLHVDCEVSLRFCFWFTLRFHRGARGAGGQIDVFLKD